jgi:sugar lactone lactonase YvrE
VGLQSGLYRFDPTNGEFDRIVEVEPEIPTNRLNDGVVDPAGRLWFGTMDNKERDKSGAFYCFDSGELRRTTVTGISITNGPAVSPDGRTLYWVDTLGGTIAACDIADDASLGPSRPVVRIPPTEGYPDGPTIDSEGCVWISLYAGWEARRYSPSGEILERVRFPVANITKIAFGGPDLRTVFATTARQLLKPDALERQPQAGDLFQFQTDVPGVPCPLVRY